MPTVTSCAFLGSHPSLSLAELRAAVPGFTLKRMVGQSIALFETAEPIERKRLTTWGGIFLVALELQSGKLSLDDVPSILLAQTKDVKGKITFSLRAYGVQKSTVHMLYRQCKEALRKKGRPARYIGNERKPAVSALLRDSGVIDGKHGCELVILGDDKFLWVGRTVAVQDPDSYTKRDMEKPVRDTRAGLLPPKLAQMMLNYGQWLASESRDTKQQDHDSTLKNRHAKLTVFDPFCGTGVIPMEALIRKWPVLASDVSLKAVNGCEKNIEWVRKIYEIKKSDVPSTVWKQDATKSFELKTMPDVIVTETMLGPALNERPTAKDAAKMKTACEATEIAFLENVAATLPGVPVIAVFPVWFLKSAPLHLEKIWTKLHDLGFRAVLPPGMKSDHKEHPSLLYHRPDQSVGREIVMLKPLKKK